MAQGNFKEPSIPRILPDQTALSNHSRSPQEEKLATNRSIPTEPMVDDHIIHEDTWESKSRCTLPWARLTIEVGLVQPPRSAYQQSTFPGIQSPLGKHR